MVNSVLSAPPTFNMCCLKLPLKVIDRIDNARKACLWNKRELNCKGKALVAWEEACKPKKNGGLGIINLERQNDALLLKHLDKIYNSKDLPWVTLTWTKMYSNVQTPPQGRSPVGSHWWKE